MGEIHEDALDRQMRRILSGGGLTADERASGEANVSDHKAADERRRAAEAEARPRDADGRFTSAKPDVTKMTSTEFARHLASEYGVHTNH